MDLRDYITKFKKLKVAKDKNKYTTGKAPHKPILLLSLILLKKNNKIDLDNISTTIYLRELWSELWKCLKYDHPGPIYMPLYHLRSDGFWNIEFKERTHAQPRSIKSFNDMVRSISLDSELIT